MALDEIDGLSVTARSADSTRIYNYFAEDGSYLTADGAMRNESDTGWIPYVITNEALSKKDVMSKYPSARYIRICSYGKILEINRKRTNDEVIEKLSADIID